EFTVLTSPHTDKNAQEHFQIKAVNLTQSLVFVTRFHRHFRMATVKDFIETRPTQAARFEEEGDGVIQHAGNFLQSFRRHFSNSGLHHRKPSG
ncbi:MAG: hypothetical protein AAB834_05505, partial [Patescibacteria group bacterium]